MSASWKCIAFLAGLGGQLYLTVPGAGTMPMLDIASYALAGPMLIFVLARMGRFSKCTLMWGFAWTGASVISNFLGGYNTWYQCKSIMVVASSWTLMVTTWYIFKKDARLFLFYLMGCGLGCAVGVHYFQNGAYLGFMAQHNTRSALVGLVEKQIYPNYAKCVYMVIGIPIVYYWKKIPGFLLCISTWSLGVWLLMDGGSRSSFGVYLAAGACAFAVISSPTVTHFAFKRLMVFLPLAACGATLSFGLYAHMAKTGSLGEGEAQKYQVEEDYSSETGESRLTARGGFAETWEVFKEKPWGEGGSLHRHSVISNSWNNDGVVGLLFWVYFYWLVIWFFKNKMAYSGRWSGFLTLQIIGACWAVAGSPFGARHVFFSLMMFISLCRDDRYYGYGSLFDGDQRGMLERKNFHRF